MNSNDAYGIVLNQEKRTSPYISSIFSVNNFIFVRVKFFYLFFGKL